MTPTWEWMIVLAGWTFLAGTVIVTASAFPAVARRWPRATVWGFLLGILSFVLVLAAWGVPRMLARVVGTSPD